MNKAYERINWENYPSENTALNEANLNKMDAALNEVDNRVVAHETTKLDVATANSMVKNVSFNERSGIFTITYLNGSTKELDTKLEKIATNFVYDEERQKLILTLIDGTIQEIDMSALITQYEFEDSAYISFSVVSGKVKAEIINGSITADKLQPNFLADVTLQANSAKTSEQNAKVSEENAKQSEINAKNYADSAEPVASTAQGLNPTLDNSTDAPIISMLGNGETIQNFDKVATLTEEGGNVKISRIDYCIGTIKIKMDVPRVVVYSTYDYASGIEFTHGDGIGVNPKTEWTYESDGSLGYSFKVKGATLDDNIVVTVNGSEYIPASHDNEVPIYGVGESRNLYDESTYPLTLNKYLNIENGNMADSTSNTYYATVDYVPFEYTGSIAKSEKVDICFYDENKVFLDGYSNATKVIKVPNGTKFVRLDVHKDYKNVLQIEKGTKATPYKAFGAHSLSVKTTGKCIFGGLALAQALVDSGSTNVVLDTDAKTIKYGYNTTNEVCVLFDKFKENTRHTLILGVKDHVNAGAAMTSYNLNLFIRYTDGTTDFLALTKTATPYTAVITTAPNKSVKELRYYYGERDTTTLYYEKCGIFEGVITADEFEPYTETTANIPLSAPLYDGDYIRLNMDGTGEESHKKVKVVLDGSSDEVWGKSASASHYYVMLPNSVPQSGKCTHFSVNTGTGWGGLTDNTFDILESQLRFEVVIDGVTDLATWKAWLKTNPITVVYEKAEPTVTPLTAEQIAEFEKLRTFDGTTHVTCEAECEIQYFYNSVSGKAVAMVANMLKK